MLRDLPIIHDSRILSGRDLADDSGIFRLTDDIALVQTIDFFTPVVDDPYTYGQIAAANALSDVYAMGGTPLTALNVTVYPTKTLSLSILTEILRGGSDKTTEAGVPIIGGHTVDGDEPMYGLSVTGTIHPDRIVKPSGGQWGDVLVITKPIGTGVIATALKAGKARPGAVDEAMSWMSRLNRSASQAMIAAGARASTDVTGFGLLGHLSEMARASGLAAELNFNQIPVMSEALEYADAGFIPEGGRTNAAYVNHQVHFADSVPEAWRLLLNDPQTSGGLIVAVPDANVDTLLTRLTGAGDVAARIGRLIKGSPGHVQVV